MSDSYIKLPAEQVLLMCHETIEYVHNKRKQKRYDRINLWLKEEAKKKPSWSTLWFKPKVHSYLELEHIYDKNENEWCSLEYDEQSFGIVMLEVANKLAKLARYGDPVNVCGEDLSYLVEL